MASLESQLARFAAMSEAKTKRVIKASSWRICTGTVSMSPVDTGSFKNSWFAAFGSPDLSLGTPDSGSTLPQLNAKIAQWDIQEDFYYTNSQPYAIKLEYGYSDQAAQGMVRITARTFVDIVNEELARD